MNLRTCPQCQLIEQWKHLPLAIAGSYASGDEDLRDDLASAGFLALCQAAEIWKPNPKGFGRFAATRIRWAMLNELHKRGKFTQRQVQLIMVARRVQRDGQLDQIIAREWASHEDPTLSEGD